MPGDDCPFRPFQCASCREQLGGPLSSVFAAPPAGCWKSRRDKVAQLAAGVTFVARPRVRRACCDTLKGARVYIRNPIISGPVCYLRRLAVRRRAEKEHSQKERRPLYDSPVDERKNRREDSDVEIQTCCPFDEVAFHQKQVHPFQKNPPARTSSRRPARSATRKSSRRSPIAATSKARRTGNGTPIPSTR